MGTSTGNNRLSGLPRISKTKPKKPASPLKAKAKSLASPPKSKAKSLASPPKPNTRSLASPPKLKAAPLPALSSNPSTPTAAVDLSLSDSSLSALSSDESDDSDEELASPKLMAAQQQKGKGKAPATPLAFPFLFNPASLPALPALPPLPPLPKKAPKPAPGPSAPSKQAKPVASTSSAPKPPVSKSSAPAPAPKSTKPAASTSSTPASKPSTTSTPQSSKPSSAAASAPKARSRSRNDPPVASTSTAALPKPKAVTPKPASTHASSNASTSDGSYAPHIATARSTPSAPQRTSLRQVLALSLQEAEEKAKSPAMSRENSSEGGKKEPEQPKPAYVPGRGKGLPQVLAELERKEREKAYELEREREKEQSKGKERERFDDVSELELDAEDGMSASSVLSDVEGEETSSDELELQKEEERLLRAEFERKARRRRGSDAMDVDDETTDEEDLAGAWERNVRALERLRRRGGGDDFALDTSLQGEQDEDEDSDLAVTEIPPGNGFGVVTWSDYEFEEEDEDDEEEGDEEETTAVAETPADDAEEPDLGEETLAAKFEDELERLFALSEAVVGPVQNGEYDLGNMWLEALSDVEEGTEADDESDSGDDEDEDDIDAEMIFGPDGELKKLFGRRRKRRHSAVESSAGESDDDEAELSSEDDAAGDEAQLDDIELVRIGVALEQAESLRRLKVGEEGNDADYDEDATSVYDTEDEATDSSCSETDIYRYAPRTSSLSALQTPTTVELASLNDPDSSAAKPASRDPSTSRARQHKGRSKAPLAVIPESIVSQVSAAVAKSPHRRGPLLGAFEPVQRTEDAPVAPLKVIVIDESGVPAPSPFSATRKTNRRVLDSTPSRRIRADSRFSSTSGTSGAESADMGSNIGSPVLANVDFGFDFDSVLHESVLVDAEMRDENGTSSETDANGATTDGGAGSSKPGAALSDFSRWSRIPIGAFRSRTTGAAGSSAPSQVFAANVAASAGKNKRSSGKADRQRGATAMLRDRKAAAKLDHTLGSPGHAATTSKRSIASRMLTSPVLAPVIRATTTAASSDTKNGVSSGPSAKKAKRSRRSTPAASTRGKSPSRSRSRATSTADVGLSASTTSSALTAPTASLPPLHSPLFRSVTDSVLPNPSSFRLD